MKMDDPLVAFNQNPFSDDFWGEFAPQDGASQPGLAGLEEPHSARPVALDALVVPSSAGESSPAPSMGTGGASRVATAADSGFDPLSFLPDTLGQEAEGSSSGLLPPPVAPLGTGAHDTSGSGTTSFQSPEGDSGSPSLVVSAALVPPASARDVSGQPTVVIDGNHDGIPDATQPDVATVSAATGRGSVTLDVPGHPLSDVRVSPAPTPGPGQPDLPYGLFGFTVHDVQAGGIAVVRMILPEGARPSSYFKQDPLTGQLAPFAFDGTTGAEVSGNVVTLHLQDGGRGDADGVANGVIVDPGGPGTNTVTVTALDAHATESPLDRGTFRISRVGDTTVMLMVNVVMSGTATNGTDYQNIGPMVTIPAGASYADVMLTPTPDMMTEGNETATLTVTTGMGGYQVGTPASATVTIHDVTPPTVWVVANDPNASEVSPDPGQFTVWRSGGNTALPLTVNFSVGGSATRGIDYVGLPNITALHATGIL
jgi:hypothetical protein